MKDHYLIHACNSLKGAIKYSDPGSSRSIFQYDKKSAVVFLNNACTGLRLLSKDDALLLSISESKSGDLSDLSGFFEEFLSVDQALMVSAGMDPKVVRFLFEDAAATLYLIKKSNGMSLDLLRKKIDALCEMTCSEAAVLNAELNRGALLRGVIKVLGGASIVVTNTLAGAVLTPPFIALSQAFGGYILGKGLDRGG